MLKKDCRYWKGVPVNNSDSSRRQIIASVPQKTPYGAKLTLFLDGHRRFKFEGETCLLIGKDHVIQFVPGDKLLVRHEIKNPEFQVWDIYIEGFPSATDAEKAGLRLATSLFWSAISKEYPMRLIYHTPLPCDVYNRNKSEGFTFKAYGHSSFEEEVQSIVEGLETVYCTSFEIEPKLLLAMELFTAAPLEITQKARFIMLLTSLEALAEQESYGEKVSQIIDFCKAEITKNPSVKSEAKASILDRLTWLNQESITHSIVRLIRQRLPCDSEAENIFREAYRIRGELLHRGQTEANIEELSRKIKEIMRKLFASYFALRQARVS